MTHQGFIGSLSTSALLVSASVAILLLVSAIVAFEGWPGPTGDTPMETFLVRDARVSAGDRPDPELILDPPRNERAGSTALTADTAGGVGAGDVGTSASPAGAGGAPVPAQAVGPVAPAGGSDGPPIGGSLDPGGSPAVSDPVGGGTLENVVDGANDAVGEGTGALPPVPDAVEGLAGGSTERLRNVIGR